MNLTYACTGILDQLHDLLKQLEEQDFKLPVKTLSGSTIGQHMRHTLEFFICLEQGLLSGVINYDKRNHDKLIETDKELALATISRVASFIKSQKSDQSLILEVGYDVGKDDPVTLTTSYHRELVYNIEHAVHHMALIKIGVNEMAPYVSLPAEFGVAASTLRFQESVAPSR
jgi:uncharacterized damage-inducible protein DinB